MILTTVRTSDLTMEQSPSWNANSRSPSQDIPALLLKEKFTTVSQELATRPYPQPDVSSPHSFILFR